MHKKIRGHVTLAIPSFRKNLSGHVQAIAGNMIVKFEFRSFNSFGASSI